MSRNRSFWAELKRRHVVRVLGTYVVAAVAVAGAADVFLPGLGAPDWVLTTVLVLLILGLPVAIALAWAFDVTPAGIEKTAATEDAATAGETAPEQVAQSGPPATRDEAPPTPTADPKSVAVLSFANMTADPENEYFGDGMAEEIINALVQLPGLRVAGRTSAFSFKGKNEDLRVVAGQLGVATVLEGSVRRAGDRVRVTAQLINAADGYHLWSEQFDRTLDDIFAVQDEIARAIADRLRVEMAPDSVGPLVREATSNREAYEHFLKGRHYAGQLTDPSLVAAGEAFDRAISLDPEYAVAYAALAESQFMAAALMAKPADRSRATQAAREAAAKAVELRPDLAEAHAALGGVRCYIDLDWNGAEQSLQRALQIDPSCETAHTWYGDLMYHTGRYPEALAEARRAAELDPLNPISLFNLVQDLWATGLLDDAADEARRGSRIIPDAWFWEWWLGLIAWKRREGEAAISHLARADSVANDETPFAAVMLAGACFCFGQDERGMTVRKRIEGGWDDEHIDPTVLAFLHLFRREWEEAAARLREGAALGGMASIVGMRSVIPVLEIPLGPAVAAEFERMGFR